MVMQSAVEVHVRRMPAEDLSVRRAAVAPAPARVGPEVRLSNAFADFVDSGTGLIRYTLRHPDRFVRAALDIRLLPLLPAVLPPGQEAVAVRRLLMRHAASRLATSGTSAVLVVPTAPGAYLDGHDRATVRRKVRAAERHGVVVRPVLAADRRAMLDLADRQERENWVPEYRVKAPDNEDLLDYDLWLAAYDADGRPLALAVAPIAGEWAALRYLRTLDPGRASSDARYLITAALAEALRERGARWLVDTARPHWLPNGLRHFQRMVGFRLVRVGRPRG